VGPDATYITFRLGTILVALHLDQGAFTLYKAGELALDSGFTDLSMAPITT